MKIPVTHKDIEVNDRSFRLTKMNAMTGSYMLMRLTSIIVPIFKNMNMKDIDKLDIDNINLTDILSPISSLPEDEFRYIQDNCLKTVKEILPAGLADVVDKDGNFGVENIEFDVGLTMNLTVQALIFNVSGFLEGSPLSSALKGLNLFQPNSKM